jgi:hypothetical protein
VGTNAAVGLCTPHADGLARMGSQKPQATVILKFPGGIVSAEQKRPSHGTNYSSVVSMMHSKRGHRGVMRSAQR